MAGIRGHNNVILYVIMAILGIIAYFNYQEWKEQQRVDSPPPAELQKPASGD